MTDTTALQEPASSVQASAHAALDEALAKSLHMAVQFHEAGDVGSAETLYRGILEAQPDHPEANSLLGRLALQVGQLQGALPYLAAALQARPDQEHYWVDYLDALIQADELATVRRLLTLAGKQEDLRGGQALEAVAGRLEERARAKMAPPRRELDRLLACFGQGRLAEAEELARSLTERFPGHGLAWKILGVARSKRLGPETSIEPLRKAVEVWPDDAEAHVNLAISYEGLDRVSEAEACYQRALELNPAQARACNNLGVIWKEQGRSQEAEALFRRAVKARPNMPDAYNNLGILQKTVGQLADAEASYRRALKVAPNMAAAHTNLGVLLYDQYRAAEGEASLRRALTLLPPEHVLEGGRSARLRAAMHGNLLFYLTLHQTQSPDQLFAEHRRFAERFEAPLRPLRREHANSRDPERVLQVGLVSNDLYNHAVASFLEPVLAKLVGNTRLSLHAYSNNATEDFVTARLRRLVPHWYRVGRVGDAALADQIRADGIDILIDLSGHTENSRMLCFARKPAPVQVSWMGYPGTTGLESVDYYLADRFIVPPGSLDDQFSEKLVYLPANAPFQPSDGAVAVNALPALSNGHVTFGSFNRPNKLSRAVIALWAQLLRAVPGARMVLGAMPKDSDCAELVGWFAEEGIVRDRLDFHPRSVMRDYLALHHQVDFCLDTFPYAGGTTTLHALSMGVPTLTLAGSTMAARVGAGILGHVGLEAFVAESPADFVERGVAWSNRLPELAELRAGMRDRFARSAIGQPELVAAGLESALRTMWRRWCAGLPPESFEALPQTASNPSSEAQP